MKKYLKLLPLSLAMLTLTSGNAEEVKAKFNQGEEVTKDQMSSGYNAPARYVVGEDWNFYLSGSFIFWQPVERGLDFAMTSPAAGEIKYTKKTLNFKFKPGFKVAMGLAFDKHDDWIWATEYTWLNCKNKRTLNAPTGGHLLTIWEYNVEEFGSAYADWAHAKWRLNYNMFDTNFSRPFYQGTMLTVKPHAGLRGGWINQKYHVSYMQDDSTSVMKPHARQKTWLVGPRIGLSSDWLLGAGFSFFANGAASILYQDFRTHFYRTSYAETPANISHVYEKMACFTPNFELGLGFGWGSYFCDNGCHFDLRVGYDFQVYLQENAMRPLKDYFLDGATYEYVDGNMGNLMLQGLTVTLRFDF